ncbi:MAG: exodeoxyribonuclease V subunit gamma [Gammaproteobacteria bacterium]
MTKSPLPAGFMVIHSNQAELLRQLVVNWTKAHPLAPLEDEVILVQSNGVSQWLKQALAADESDTLQGGCGIAAALQVTLPSRFIWQAYRTVLGQEQIPETSPFDKPLLIWRLMRLLPQLIESKGYEPLARFLRQDDDLRKRYQLAERLADLFDQYQVYRADWLAAWTQGQDVMLDYHGGSKPISAEQCWQAMLWRALHDDVGADGNTSRAAVHRRFLEAAANPQQRPPRLPRRVVIFGLSSLPKQSLEVLFAVSRWSQVLLCVNNPCEHYWANILTEKDYFRRTQKRHRQKAGMPEMLKEEELHLHAQPLLAAWGKQGRDYIGLLDEMDDPSQYRTLFTEHGQRIDLFESHGNDCLLNQLQDDIRDLRPVAESRSSWSPIDPAHDLSIRFHICHSPQREVEVLHDQLLAAFDADPTLKARQIIVMVPDINQYAPHIQAVFGQIASSDDRFIPYSIADLGRRQQAPLVFALECLLNINESRMPVSEVLDLLNVPAVRLRFGIAEADLPLLQHWITHANIRWGLNAAHRTSLGIEFSEGNEQNTWLFGLKRMLLGYAVGNDPSGRQESDWHDIEPYGDIVGLDAALVGPLAQLLTQLKGWFEILSKPATASEWSERLRQLLSDFFEAADSDDGFLLLRLQSTLEQWQTACEDAELVDALPLSVVRDFWLSQIDQGGLLQRFFAGNLTFATLMPMRAIPFRRIYLLGMNDGEYPRVVTPMDFDLMARDYRPGDRSRREDDRYLFLEALLSAREHLHISWIGRSINDNSERPPSVLVSQLRDHIAACWSLAGNAEKKNLIDALTVEHRLQAFSKDYFASESTGLFSYAREWRRNSTSTLPAQPSPTKLAMPQFDAPVPLQQLIAFLKDPVKTFMRERLGVFYEVEDLAAEDQEPFAIDALDQWSMQDELIRVRLDAKRRGDSESAAVQRQLDRLRRQGLLPIGARCDLSQAALIEPLEQLFELYDEACKAWPEPIIDQDIRFTHTIEGQVIEIYGRLNQVFMNSQRQRCRIEIITSNLIKDKRYRHDKLIPAWVHHLAGHLNGQPMTTHLIGKNGRAVLHPLAPKLARQHFLDLTEAYAAGLCLPLPIAVKTSFDWLAKNGEAFTGTLDQCPSDKAASSARKAYEGGYLPGELAKNAYLQRVFPSFESLWSQGNFTVWTEKLLCPIFNNVGEKADQGQSQGDKT